MFDEEDAIFDLTSQADRYWVVRIGPETKKHDSDQTNKQTNKQTSFIPLFAVKTKLSSDKINNNDTMIYVKCNETNLKI